MSAVRNHVTHTKARPQPTGSRNKPGSSAYSSGFTGVEGLYEAKVTLPRLRFLGDEVSDMLEFAKLAAAAEQPR